MVKAYVIEVGQFDGNPGLEAAGVGGEDGLLGNAAALVVEFCFFSLHFSNAVVFFYVVLSRSRL